MVAARSIRPAVRWSRNCRSFWSGCGAGWRNPPLPAPGVPPRDPRLGSLKISRPIWTAPRPTSTSSIGGHLERRSGQRLIHLLHGLDHLQRLHERLEEEPERLAALIRSPLLAQERQDFARMLNAALPRARRGDWAAWPRAAAAPGGGPGASRCGGGDPAAGGPALVERVCVHIERIGHHLARASDRPALPNRGCPPRSFSPC